MTFSCLLMANSSILSAATIPPEMEAARLILAAKSALDNQQLTEAQDYLTRAQALNTPLTHSFYFYQGKVSFLKSELKQAQQQLIKFAQQIKPDDLHYEETLALLTEIEKQSSIEKTPTQPPKPQIEWHSEKAVSPYIERLKNLYLTDQGKDALEQHINDLLRAYPFRQAPANIIPGNNATRNSKRVQHQTYNIQTTRQGAIKTHLTTHRPNATPNKNVELNISEISVYGLHHRIGFKCNDINQSCWLKNPINNSVWLKLGNNQPAAQELAKAMSHLVKVMQKQ